MAYNEALALKVREALSTLPNVQEKKMMGGLTFMVNDKMCLGIVEDELMCRIDPEKDEEALSKTGCRRMDFTGKPMKGYVFVNETGFGKAADFIYWVKLALDFNSRAKSSKKK